MKRRSTFSPRQRIHAVRQMQLPGMTSRRGVLTVWSVWLVLAFGLIAAGVFNGIWFSSLCHQARHCAECAALAAGYGYLSDDMLRFDQQTFQAEGRIARAENAAIRVASEYRTSARLPVLSASGVSMQWPDVRDQVRQDLCPIPESITVAFGGNSTPRIPAFFSGLAGAMSTQASVSCKVSLERTPAAFRPGHRNNVPLLPFGISDDPAAAGSSSSAAGFWTEQIESGRGRDLLTWNEKTHQFEQGPDGLPEITVSLSAATGISAPDAFIPLSFAAPFGSTNTERFTDWIRNGLSISDLQTQGLQELSFPGSIPCGNLSAKQLPSVAAALKSKTGIPCIVCLCSPFADSLFEKSSAKISLKRPVAARIALVEAMPGGAAKVILQPCVLSTSTAVTSTKLDAARNRYVYSVRICR